MTTSEEREHEVDPRIEAFWEVAKRRARLSVLPGYFGPSPLASLAPPVWSFGEEGEADFERLLADGELTSSVPRSAYGGPGEPLPEVGTLGIVTDPTGRPRALVGTTAVVVDDGHGAVVETLTVLYSED